MAPKIAVPEDVKLRDFFRSIVEDYNPLFAFGLLSFANLI